MKIDIKRGILSEVSYIPSPNFNQRPASTVIDCLVIHGISLPSGEFGGDAITALFCNQLDPAAHASFAALADVQVSAHLFIRRPGEIIQYVPLHARAWHAGRSHFNGRDECNDFSIGIELEGTDTTPYTAAQYRQLVAVAQQLMQTYPAITPQRIVGHCDIAPGRKTDPGDAFDWPHFHQLLAKALQYPG